MSDIFIKATAIGFDYKTWKEDVELFSSILVSVLQTWLLDNFNSQGNLKHNLPEKVAREYGRIKNAYFGLESDIHNLSINYNLIISILKNNKIKTEFKALYISLLVENYIVNIRSIYDFTSFFPGIFIKYKDIDQLPKGSLNSFVKHCKKNKNRSTTFPQKIYELMINTECELKNIRLIRDAIIHHGKESIITLNEKEPVFRIPKTAPYGVENYLPDILSLGNIDYPLFNYLKALSIKMINYMESLGNIMGEEFYMKDKDFKLKLTALTGICMKNYLEFLFTEIEQ
jgi:hypothetical protein